MRDVERLREKHEFSLDDRQMAALALCALLIVGGVFALGLLLGKRMSEAPPPSGDLAALDEAAHKGPPAAAAVVPSRPTPRAAPPPADEEAAPEQGKPPASLPPEEKTAAPRPPPQRAQADSPHTVVPPPQRAPTVVAAPPRPAQVASAAASGGAGSAGDGRSPKGAASIDLTPPPRDLGQYAVQVGASQDKAEAQKLEQRVRAAGLKPYVVEADLGAKGVWYRVRVGAFPDKDAANRYRTDVERELRAPAVVMSTR